MGRFAGGGANSSPPPTLLPNRPTKEGEKFNAGYDDDDDDVDDDSECICSMMMMMMMMSLLKRIKENTEKYNKTTNIRSI